ncbi:hypothetical protein C8F01DRAFT_1257769 [Mycena amicta]|nr:hypothetical protein C8F01DRAFT_1257769 [Mycena amicta]
MVLHLLHVAVVRPHTQSRVLPPLLLYLPDPLFSLLLSPSSAIDPPASSVIDAVEPSGTEEKAMTVNGGVDETAVMQALAEARLSSHGRCPRLCEALVRDGESNVVSRDPPTSAQLDVLLANGVSSLDIVVE